MKINLRFLALSRFRGFLGQSILDFLIEFTYLAVIFLIPLWFSYFFPTYNIFELNKIVLFKILVWLLLLFTLLKVIFYPPRLALAPLKFFKKYWLMPAIFIVGLSLTLITSLNPAFSFYGSPERQQGLTSYLFYFLWFILVSFNILTINNLWRLRKPNNSAIAAGAIENGGYKKTDDTHKKITKIIITAVISGSLVALYGILQILNIDFLSWPEPPFLTHRAFSSLGQPNFLASWLLLIIPLSGYLFYKSRRVLVKFTYFLALAAQIICLFLTGSRGGLIAGFAAAVLFLIYLLVVASWTRRQKLLAGLFFLILTVATLWGLNFLYPGRVRDLFDYNSGSLGARTNFYFSATDAIKSRPISGYGLENSGEVFIRYYQPDWGVYGDVGQSADRAHNLVLDILLTSGAIGLILFTALYYFFFYLVKDNRWRKKKEPALILALALGAAAYLLSLLFSFTIVTGEVYFWLFLALLVVINFDGNEGRTTGKAETSGGLEIFRTSGVSSTHSNQGRRLIKIIIALIFTALIFWQIDRVLKILIADYYFNRIYFSLARQNYFTALVLDDYLRAQKTNLVNQESYNFFWAEKLCELYPSINDLTAKKVMTQKLKELDQVLPARGYKNILIKARINEVLGNFSIAQKYLSQVITITPHWPLVYLEQGRLSAAAQDFKAAIVGYHLAALNLPDVNDPRLNELHRQIVQRYQYFINWQIGAIYEREENYAAAEKYYQLAYQNNPEDFTLLKKIADTYYLRGDSSTAIKYNQHGLTRNPDDYNWPLALAILSYESGRKEQAISYLEQALKLAPDNEELKKIKEEYEK